MAKKTEPDLFEPNQARYRELSVPHESLAKANEELQAFWKGVADLRIKHRIRDVQLIVSFAAKTEDGSEGDGIIDAMLGDEHKSEMLLAYALGKAQLRRQERIGAMLAGTVKQPR